MIPLDDLRLEVDAARERGDEYLPVSVASVVDFLAVADRERELLGIVEKAVVALETATEALAAGEKLPDRAILTARLLKETGELRETVAALLVDE